MGGVSRSPAIAAANSSAAGAPNSAARRRNNGIVASRLSPSSCERYEAEMPTKSARAACDRRFDCRRCRTVIPSVIVQIK